MRKIVPKLLSPDQKNRRIQCCQDWIDAEEGTDFLDRIITEDESWFYKFDPELKSQNMERKKQGEPRTKKSKKSKIQHQDDAHCFFLYPCHCAS